MLDVKLDELFAAAQGSRRDEKASKGLIARGWIELVVAFVANKARTDSTEPDWLRVTLNLLNGEVRRKIEYADAFEVVTEIRDEIERVALLNLKVRSIAISAEVFFTKPTREN